jgi:putative redox protein
MTVRHVLKGDDLDPIAVARAVELSDTKYCTVIATLRKAPAITSEYRIEG